MHQKALAICLTQHHFEKGLYLSKISKVPIEIACIGFQPKQASKEVLDKFQLFNSFTQIVSFIHQYEKFIFFNTSPSKPLFKLISEIRKVKKNIIAIQETHQLGMHLGAINSIIFSPDIILAASDLEKKLLTEKRLFLKENIASPGWLFQREYHDYINSLRNKSLSSSDQKYVLVFFSAPNDITATSPETYEVRKVVLQTIQNQFQNTKFLIKLHPLENIKPFKRYIEQAQTAHLEFVDNTQDIWDLAQNSHGLIVSSRTQAFVDLIEHDKEMLVYQLGNENFITSYLKKNNAKESVKGDINFYLIKNPSKDLKIFKDTYCRSEEVARNFFIDLMLQKNLPVNNSIFFEEAAWAFLFGEKAKFKNLSKEIGFSRSLQAKNIFNLAKGIDFLRLDNELDTLSARTSISLILMREIVAQNFIQQNAIKDFVEIFFTTHIIQYFYIDSIIFEFFLSRNEMNHYIHPEALNLLKATRIALAKKSNIAKWLFFIERKALGWNSKLFKGIIFSLIHVVFIFSRNIKN